MREKTKKIKHGRREGWCDCWDKENEWKIKDLRYEWKRMYVELQSEMKRVEMNNGKRIWRNLKKFEEIWGKTRMEKDERKSEGRIRQHGVCVQEVNNWGGLEVRMKRSDIGVRMSWKEWTMGY